MGLARAPVCHLLGGYASTISSHTHGYATSFERMLVLHLRQGLIFIAFFPRLRYNEITSTLMMRCFRSAPAARANLGRIGVGRRRVEHGGTTTAAWGK
jgi:hypothetical protein